MQTPTKNRQFEQLIDQELPKLRGLAYRILKNAADTDDVIQEALLKAYARFDSFKNESALSSWICRIVINSSYDLLRERKREREGLQGYSPENSGGIDTSALEAAIADLPEPYRNAITIGLLSDYDGKTAAAILGISPNTLYQRIFKAKQMLKNTLTQEK